MGEDLIEKSVMALGINPSVAERLSHPERVIEFTFPVRRDNGKVVFLKGYRAQYNSALGSYKGGVRFHPAVDRDEVVLLAKLMVLKNSLAGLPYGGAKGGVAFNPKEFSRSEIERVARAYARNIAPFIGPDVDIPAPDVNTNAETIAWMADEHNSIAGRKEYAAYTGKPVEFGGLKGREEATGLGVYYIMERALETHNVGKGARIAIQGFGNVAMSLARSLHSNGYKVVALSDSKGGIYDEKGIDVEKAIAVKVKGGSVTECKGAKAITCLLYTSQSPRDRTRSRMPSSA